MNTNCSGSRAHHTHGGAMPRYWSGFSAMWMFAGKTATSKAIVPHAAATVSGGISSPSPQAISHAPLTSTSSRCHGRYGGMIRT